MVWPTDCDTTFVPFSYYDNRTSLGIAAFDDSGTLLGVLEAQGTRYAYAATVDTVGETVTFFGQEAETATVTFAQLDAISGS
jgi:hypothetical protein